MFDVIKEKKKKKRRTNGISMRANCLEKKSMSYPIKTLNNELLLIEGREGEKSTSSCFSSVKWQREKKMFILPARFALFLRVVQLKLVPERFDNQHSPRKLSKNNL